MDKLVSIILPTYNRAGMLKKALESCLNQTYRNIEIVVGDNHSSDETENYLLKEAESDERIKYFRWDKNIGAYNNTAELLKRIKGDYFVFLNDDDWLDLNYVEECVKFIENNEGYAFVTPQVILYNEDYTFFEKRLAPNLTSESAENRIATMLEYYWRSDIVSGFFRKEVIDCMQKYDNYYFKKRLVEDVIFMIRALAVGKGKILTKTHYRKLNNGATRVLENIPEDYCDTTGITRKNFHKKCIECLCNVILEDKIFLLSIEDPKKFTKNLVPYLKNVWGMSVNSRLIRILRWLYIYKRVYAI